MGKCYIIDLFDTIRFSGITIVNNLCPRSYPFETPPH